MYTTKKGGMIMKLSNMSKMSGFTLAEVLITLGIIGVVAAMTMPTLINSTQGRTVQSCLQKSFVSNLTGRNIERSFGRK